MDPSSVKKPKYHAEGYREKFLALFPELVAELTDEGLANPEIVDAMQHTRKTLEYNVPGGKMNRGLMVIGSLRHLVGSRELTEEEEKKALVLGWCVEWLQAFFLVSDDIMDQSKTRRGKKCWYLKDGVGLIAINDALLIEGTIYNIIKKHFKPHPAYMDIVDLFHQVTHQTEVGQCLDLLTSPSEGVDFSLFTLERYKAIVKYKTAFYSFYLPVALAMHLAGISDEQSHSAARDILLQMGEFFQIQDDFIDCYGDPAVTGKVGTDIEECKCGWLAVQALLRATPEQQQFFKDNYGCNDPDHVSRIKQLYKDLDLKGVYHQHEEESYRQLMANIERETRNKPSLPPAMFQEFADRIYKRKS